MIENQPLTRIEARLPISRQGNVTAVSNVTLSGNKQVHHAVRQRLFNAYGWVSDTHTPQQAWVID